MTDPCKSTITLEQIEARMVDPSIVHKMVRGFFDRVSKPNSHIDDNVLTISCVDSRLPPARVLGQEHGQSYAIQTVANVVPRLDKLISFDDQPIEVAAGIQYCLEYAEVKDIIIMGHTDCGGAEARILQPQSLTNVNKWMSHVCKDHHHAHPPNSITTQILREQHHEAYEALRRVSERQCLTSSMANIKEMPFIAQAIKKTKLSLAGLICEMNEGRLELIDGDISAFKASAELIRRFNRFKEEAWGPNGYMKELVINGQRPKALIVTGISPYVAPENVFGIEPGDSFVHRRIGGHYHHQRSSDGLAATIEFAVAAKEVQSLIFVGHRNDVNRDYAEGKMDNLSLVKGFLEKCCPEIRQQRLAGMDPASMHERNLKATYLEALKHPAVEAALQGKKLSVAAIMADDDKRTLEFYDPLTDELKMIIPPAL